MILKDFLNPVYIFGVILLGAIGTGVYKLIEFLLSKFIVKINSKRQERLKKRDYVIDKCINNNVMYSYLNNKCLRYGIVLTIISVAFFSSYLSIYIVELPEAIPSYIVGIIIISSLFSFMCFFTIVGYRFGKYFYYLNIIESERKAKIRYKN